MSACYKVFCRLSLAQSEKLANKYDKRRENGRKRVKRIYLKESLSNSAVTYHTYTKSRGGKARGRHGAGICITDLLVHVIFVIMFFFCECHGILR